MYASFMSCHKIVYERNLSTLMKNMGSSEPGGGGGGGGGVPVEHFKGDSPDDFYKLTLGGT